MIKTLKVECSKDLSQVMFDDVCGLQNVHLPVPAENKYARMNMTCTGAFRFSSQGYLTGLSHQGQHLLHRTLRSEYSTRRGAAA